MTEDLKKQYDHTVFIDLRISVKSFLHILAISLSLCNCYLNIQMLNFNIIFCETSQNVYKILVGK